MLRKVAVAAASKPHVEIRQDGDQFYIKTSTTVRTTEINFKVGEGFEEETVDGRKCRVRSWSPGSVPDPDPYLRAAVARPARLPLQPVARSPRRACVHWLFAERILCDRTPYPCPFPGFPTRVLSQFILKPPPEVLAAPPFAEGHSAQAGMGAAGAEGEGAGTKVEGPGATVRRLRGFCCSWSQIPVPGHPGKAPDGPHPFLPPAAWFLKGTADSSPE